MEHTENVHESEKLYRGAITIFYKNSEEGRKYLVVENAETGNITFVSGGEEDGDEGDLLATALREIREELQFADDTYIPTLKETEAHHKFVFNEKKKERAGKRGLNTVFLSDLSDMEDSVGHSKDLKGIGWKTEQEVLDSLSFDDLKPVFKKAIEYIE